eukprot:Nitzschia sp. Nitz4//scaffold215_size37433//34737//36959//NITZ4_007756-RA/size37433-snap-gene-0.5-mRNA-1//-1//CDS//3329542166//230//frame0
MEQCATTGDCEVLWQEYKNLVSNAQAKVDSTTQDWEERVKARFHSAVQIVQQHQQDAEATYQVELNHMIHRLPWPGNNNDTQEEEATGSDDDDDEDDATTMTATNNNSKDTTDKQSTTQKDSSHTSRHLLGTHNIVSSHHKTSKSSTTAAVGDNVNGTTATAPEQVQDPFLEYLNWATKHNPDKVPLVHNTGFDQGSCGSCWAYAATGSLEASVARQSALDAYHWALDWLQQHSTHGLHRRHRLAKKYARKVEELVFSSTNLSVQELLDCDTRADQGCIGGNPLLAYFYIYRHGLVSWDDYPYEEEQDSCPFRPTGKSNTRGGGKSALAEERTPVATAGSWGILPKNYEDTIAFALRHIGPVSVGIHGDDPQFLLYKGGIFNKATCPQDANHAVLLVGYGQQEMYTPNGKEMVRYWIARNSWGDTWGENGYIRIRRGSGEKKVAGICGLARSPSIALAGRLLVDFELPPLTFHSEPDLLGPTPTISTLQNSGSNPSDINSAIGITDYEFYNVYYKNARDEFESIERMSKNTLFCDSLVPKGGVHVRQACYSVANLVDTHWVTILGVVGILAAISVSLPLFNCCRRKRRRRPNGQECPSKSPNTSSSTTTNPVNPPLNESTPLLR